MERLPQPATPTRERPSNQVSVTITTDSSGRQRTPTDDASQVGQGTALAVHVASWLRDEEANASGEN